MLRAIADIDRQARYARAFKANGMNPKTKLYFNRRLAHHTEAGLDPAAARLAAGADTRRHYGYPA